MPKNPKTLGEARQVLKKGGRDLDKLVGDPYAGSPNNETARRGFRQLGEPEPRRPRVFGKE